MAVKFTNNAKTTLASGINSSVTTATVTDGSVFPTLAAGEHFYCTFDDGTNNEIVKVTARSGNTLTIIRGVDNTTARSFASGDAAELRATSALLTDIQENIAAKSANQTVYNTTTASSATDYDIGIDPSVEANAMVFLNGVMQHHDTFSFSGSTLSFDTAPPNGMALEVIVDNLINLQSSNLTVDTFTAADVGGNPQTDFTLSDAPAAEDNLLVFIDGVFQDQDAYTISNQTLTITDGVTADFGVTVYVINPVNIGTPSDGTVTSSKLSGNITMPADLTVTGDVAFDSPTFVVDNANSRVGIGTASPSTLLDIVGDVKMSANLTVDTDTLHVDASNNRVGVGTTSPSGVLHVKGSGNELYLERSAHDIMALGIGTVNGQKGLHITNATDSIVPVSLHENAPAASLVLDSSGNFGIGTTSPYHTFDVFGDVIANGAAKSNGLFFDTTSATTGTGGGIALGGYSNGTGGAVYHFGNIQGIKENSTAGNYASAMLFSTRANGATPTERMRIDSSGNVGIGTTSTNSFKTYIDATSGKGLFVEAGDGGYTALGFDGDGGSTKGSITSNAGSLYFGSENSGGTGSNGELRIIPGTGNVMTLDGVNGRVGIGTNSPDGLLHISSGTAGDAILILESDTDNNDEADNPQIWFKGDGDITKGAVRVDDNQLQIISNVDSASGIKFYVGGTNNTGTTDPGTSATQRMFINANGRVHIGHSTETGWDSLGTIVVQQAAADRGLGVVDEGGNNTFQFINNNTTAKIDHNLGSADIEIGTGGNHKLYIKGSTSDVGIGTNAPNGYRLEVYDGDYTQMMLRGPTYPMLRFKADNQNSGNNALLGVGAGNSFSIQPNNTTNGIIVSNSGHVTMPNQPAFHAYGPSAVVADGSYVVYQYTYVNTGSHYSTSNGRFTAPVAGVYLFFWSAIGNNTNDVYRWFIRKNGSATGIGANDVHLRQDNIATGSEYATNGSRVQMVSLSANDYIQIYYDSDSGTSAYYQSDYVNFGGYLIG